MDHRPAGLDFSSALKILPRLLRVRIDGFLRRRPAFAVAVSAIVKDQHAESHAAQPARMRSVRADAASIAVKVDQAVAIHKRRHVHIRRDPPAMQRLAARFKSDVLELASEMLRREFDLALRDEHELALM